MVKRHNPSHHLAHHIKFHLDNLDNIQLESTEFQMKFEPTVVEISDRTSHQGTSQPQIPIDKSNKIPYLTRGPQSCGEVRLTWQLSAARGPNKKKRFAAYERRCFFPLVFLFLRIFVGSYFPINTRFSFPL